MKVNWNQVVSESKLEPSCWNCRRKGHTLSICKVERNVEAMKKDRHEFREKSRNKQKKNNNKRLDHHQNKGKLAPPTRHERGKRIIDGKPMFWLRRDKKWVADKNPKPLQWWVRQLQQVKKQELKHQQIWIIISLQEMLILVMFHMLPIWR